MLLEGHPYVSHTQAHEEKLLTFLVLSRSPKLSALSFSCFHTKGRRAGQAVVSVIDRTSQ